MILVCGLRVLTTNVKNVKDEKASIIIENWTNSCIMYYVYYSCMILTTNSCKGQ